MALGSNRFEGKEDTVIVWGLEAWVLGCMAWVHNQPGSPRGWGSAKGVGDEGESPRRSSEVDRGKTLRGFVVERDCTQDMWQFWREADALRAGCAGALNSGHDEIETVRRAVGWSRAGGRAYVVLGTQGVASGLAAMDGVEGAWTTVGLTVLMLEDGAGDNSLTMSGWPGWSWAGARCVLEPDGIQGLASAAGESISLGKAAGTTVAVRVWPSLTRSGGTLNRVSESGSATSGMMARPERRAHPRGSGTVAAKDRAKRIGLNQKINWPGRDEHVPLGFVTTGGAHQTLRHALSELNLVGRLPILSMKMAPPLDQMLLREAAEHCQTLLVLTRDDPAGSAFIAAALRETLASRETRGSRPHSVQACTLLDGALGSADKQDCCNGVEALSLTGLIHRVAMLATTVAGLPRELPVVTDHDGDAASWKQPLGDVAFHDSDRTKRIAQGPCPVMQDHSTHEVIARVVEGMSNAETMRLRHRGRPRNVNVMSLGSPEPWPGELGAMRTDGPEDSLESVKESVKLLVTDIANVTDATARARLWIKRGERGVIILTGEMSRNASKRHVATLGATFSKEARTANGTRVRIESIEASERARYRWMIERSLLADAVVVIVAHRPPPTMHWAWWLARDIEAARLEMAAECVSDAGLVRLEGGSPRVMPYVYGAAGRYDILGRRGTQAAGVSASASRIDHFRLPAGGEYLLEEARADRPHADLSRNSTSQPQLPLPAPSRHAAKDVWWSQLEIASGRGGPMMMHALLYAGQRMGYRVRACETSQHRPAVSQGWGGTMPCASASSIQLVYTREDPAASDRMRRWVTPVMPPGKCDLLIASSLTDLERLTADGEGSSPLVAGKTMALVDLAVHAQAIRQGHGAVELGKAARQFTVQWGPTQSWLEDFQTRCGEVVGDPWVAGAAMLGGALQRGWLPVTLAALMHGVSAAWAPGGERVREQALQALRLGRQMAADEDKRLASLSVNAPNISSSIPTIPRRLTLDAALHRHRPSLDPPRRYRKAVAWLTVGRGVRRVSLSARLHEAFLRWIEPLPWFPDVLRHELIAAAVSCIHRNGRRDGLRRAEALIETIALVAQTERKLHPGSGQTSPPRRPGSSDFPLTRIGLDSLSRCVLVDDLIWTAAQAGRCRRLRREMMSAGLHGPALAAVVIRHELWLDAEVFGRLVSFRMRLAPWAARRLGDMRWLRWTQRAVGRVDEEAAQAMFRITQRFIDADHTFIKDPRWHTWLATGRDLRGRGVPARRARLKALRETERQIEAED